MMKFYPVLDRLSQSDREALGISIAEYIGPLVSLDIPARLRAKGVDLKAIYAGEKRPPRAGEWYLSGADPGAYRAPNDLSTVFHIAKLVLTETKTVVKTQIISPLNQVGQRAKR